MPGGAGTPGGYGGGAGFGGSSSSGGGSSGGGGSGGDGRSAALAAQAAASAARSRAAAAAAAAEADRQNRNAAAEAAAKARAAQQAAEGKVDVGFQEALRKQKIEEDLKNELDEDFLFEGAKARAPTTFKPEIEKYITRSPFTDEPIINERVKKYSPTYYQDRSKIGGETYGERAEAEIKRGGIGTTLKNIALGIVAPQLLAGTKFAPLYQGYRTYETAKRFLPKIGDIQTALQAALTREPTTGTRKTTGTKKINPLVASNRGGDGEGIKTVAEKVATGEGLESGAKLLGVNDTQKAELFKRRNMVEDILRKGSYQGRDLTSGQKNNLRNYIEQINKFLVPVQQGI